MILNLKVFFKLKSFFNILNVVYILAASTLSINYIVQSNESFNFRFEQALNLISISLDQRKPVLYLTVHKNQKPDTKKISSPVTETESSRCMRISPNLNHPLFLSVARNKPLSLSLSFSKNKNWTKNLKQT